jgi:hypothetical protein
MIRFALAGIEATPMQDYRAYIVGADGHIMGFVGFWCSDDDAAKAQAGQLVDGHDVELWQQGRKVADFKHKD